jgi:hypothetical protein
MKHNQTLNVLLFLAAVCISPGQLFAQSIEKSIWKLTAASNRRANGGKPATKSR